MSEENSSTISHLPVAMTTTENDEVQTAGATGMTSSSSRGPENLEFYFQSVLVIIGVVGVAANALIIYAMIASNQHKKQLLIFNQNIFDLCSSLLLVVTFAVKLSNIHLSGALGYWLCMLIITENLLWGSVNGGQINLMTVTIERYLKVVHHKATWSKKLLRKWVKISAAAIAWILGIVYDMVLVFCTSDMVNGVCYYYVFWSSPTAALAHGIWHIAFFLVFELFIFIFCYGRILVVIRRQARVMASHSEPGPSTSRENQSHQIQTNVIKTMITVSVVYAITWAPGYGIYMLQHIVPSYRMYMRGYYVTIFLEFLYISANPFIYAIKFDPVRRVLVRLIPWHNGSHPPADTGGGGGGTRAVGIRTTQEQH